MLLISAAGLTVIATISVVVFGGRVAAVKEAQLAVYQKDADARIAEANTKAAEANELAERERLARMKIEERLAGRRVSLEQHDQMVLILKPHPASVMIGGLYGMEESRAFAIDIQAVFRDAGWTAILNLTNSSANPPVGIECSADTTKQSGLSLRAAMRLLPNVKIITTLLKDNLDAAGSVAVGLRPPP